MKLAKKTALILLLVLLFPGTVGAQIAALDYATNPLYNPNHIISDIEMNDSGAMDLAEIKNFLENKAGTLKSYEVLTPEGLNKSAAQIIWESAQNNRINPKVLLVLLQKEQSLVENPNPSQYNLDWATGYARCDSCSQDDPTALKHKGFAKQVEDAASFLRYCFDNKEQGSNWLKKAGLIYNIDSIPVIPTNQATANLYTYTPHFYGNYNFWKIWQRWFSQKYPDGLLVQTKDDDQIWLIQDSKAYPFKNKAVFLSRFSPKNIILIDKNELASYKKGPTIKFLNYSLVKTENKKTYLLVNDKKRLLGKEAFRYYGFDSGEVISTKEADLAYYKDGAEVTVKAKYPLGTLLQENKTGAIYFVSDSIKHPVLDKGMLAINFPAKKIKKVATTELKKYQLGDPILFNDGTWLKTKESSDIYLISNGTRRLIQDQLTMKALGGETDGILITTEKVLGLYPLGEPISLTGIVTTNLTQTN